MAQSVEPQIADLVNGWLKQYKLKYFIEQDAPNPEIKNALIEYESKQGGTGGNRPDCNLLLQDRQGVWWPVLIEYKGYKERLVKFDTEGQVANRNTKGQPEYKNISQYAVNGAIHYANALLHYTSYEHVIAIGVTGHRDYNTNILHHELGVYYVGKSNYGAGQQIGEFTDLSFLAPQHFENFIEQVRNLSLTPEALEKLKQRREQEINISLVKLNNDIYQNEKGISESGRVYLVAATIIATLGIPNKVTPLEKKDLRSSTEQGNQDGDIIVRKIRAFLAEKNIPMDKQELIVRTLQNTLTTDNINRPTNGESQLKRVFCKVVDDLGIYYKIGLSTDFTGRLFNEMYNWLGFTQDKLNDVVLTPSYVATLLVRLARVNRNSYVWDFATGSAGLLVAAMNEMLLDAKANINSPEQLLIKEAEIKANQLLGLEILENIYMLAILNMILMGDGSSNILNRDSLRDFDGHYGFGDTSRSFPADAFVLNPPYSAAGNGMVFVERALSMMNHGYAAIIIQNSAGSGKAVEYNKRILEHSTLLASIKMPADLFIGKSIVQTYIYVFRVGEAHIKDDIVRFIDFSKDGYTRSNRKKSAFNLRDTDHARQRYQEVVDLVRIGKSALHYLAPEDIYEGHVDPKKGDDWNQTAPVDTRPTINNFHRTVTDYLAWETAEILKSQPKENLYKEIINPLKQQLNKIKWGEYKLGDLFEIQNTLSFNTDKLIDGEDYDYVTRTSFNQGILRTTGFINKENINPAGTWSLGLLQMDFFYRKRPWYAGQFVRKIVPKIDIPDGAKLFFQTILNMQKPTLLQVLVRNVDETFRNITVQLPETTPNVIDFAFIEKFVYELEMTRVRELEMIRMNEIEAYLKVINIQGASSETQQEPTITPLVYPEYKPGFILLYTLRAACGYFEDGEVPEEEGWVDATGHGFTPDPKRHFVVHAKGNSMLPKIKDGDLCVFEWYKAGSRNGEIVLTQSSEFDSEYGGKYTIKKYHSEKMATEEGWQHSKVELIPLNKDFDVIELDEETEYRTIGVFKCVL